MKNRSFWTGLCAGLAAFAFVVTPTLVQASSHREAPSISRDPSADNTDVYAWVKPGTRDKLYVVGNWIPLQEPAGGPNFHSFSDNVRYEIHMARGGDSLLDAVTYYVQFRTTPAKRVALNGTAPPLIGGHQFFSQLSGQKQTYSVWRIDWTGRRGTARIIANNKEVAPPNIGPRTNQLVYGMTEKEAVQPGAYGNFSKKFIYDTTDKSRIFVGPRDDPFFVDLGGVFDLANLRPKGTAQDTVSGYNVHTIALEIPTDTLTATKKAPTAGPSAEQTLGVWCASSRRRITFRSWTGHSFNFGGWVQVSRLGLPLVNEVLIGVQDKDRFNGSHPAYDAKRFGAYFVHPVIVQDAEAVKIYQALGVNPEPFKYNRTDILDVVSNVFDDVTSQAPKKVRDIKAVGDVLRVDLGVDSGFPNGRGLTTDVVDILTSYILVKALSGAGDGVDKNDVPLLTEFPFLAAPHEGRSGGHGKVPQ